MRSALINVISSTATFSLIKTQKLARAYDILNTLFFKRKAPYLLDPHQEHLNKNKITGSEVNNLNSFAIETN